MELPNIFPCRLFWEFKEEGGGLITSDLAPGRYNLSLKLVCVTSDWEWGIYCTECEVILGFPSEHVSAALQRIPNSKTHRSRWAAHQTFTPLQDPRPWNELACFLTEGSRPPGLTSPIPALSVFMSTLSSRSGPRQYSEPFLCSGLLELPQLLPFCPLASAWNISRV